MLPTPSARPRTKQGTLQPEPGLNRGPCRDETSLKIATYNVNGVNGCLNVLLRWLNEALPDVVPPGVYDDDLQSVGE